MRRNIFAALALVATLMLSVSAPAAMPASDVGPVGEADAQSQTAEWGCTATSFVMGVDNICQGGYADPEDAQDKLSLYQAGLQTDSSTNQWFDLLKNNLESGKEVAWMEAERAVAAAAANGTTETAANVDATEDINGYYTTHQRNLNDKWNLLATGLNEYRQQADNYGYDMFTTSKYEEGQADIPYNHYIEDPEIVGMQNKSIELMDGSTMNVRQLQVQVSFYEETDSGGALHLEDRTYSVDPRTGGETIRAEDMGGGEDRWIEFHIQYSRLNAPNEDYDNRNYLSYERFGRQHDRIQSQASEVKNNSETFISNVYPDLESGEISPDEVLSTVNKMYNYAADGSSENATFNEALIALSSIGMSDPLDANTSYMTVTYERPDVAGNVTNDGVLLSDDPPAGGIEPGVVYNSTNVTGPQMVVTLDGEQHSIAGDFVVEAVYDQNGNEIENPDITFPEKDYQVSNTAETQELLERLGEEIDRYENMTTDDSGAGGGDGDGGNAAGIIGNALGSIGDTFDGLGGWALDGVEGFVQMLVVGIAALVVLMLVLGAVMP